MFILSPQEKYDKMASEYGALNNKLQQLQDQSQKDIETRIQVIIQSLLLIII